MPERDLEIMQAFVSNFPNFSDFAKGYIRGYLAGKEEEILHRKSSEIEKSKIKSEKEEKKNDD